jgi:DedD protein
VDDKLKKRLVGATVLAALAIIFVPMLVEKRATPPVVTPLPELPEHRPAQFDSRLLREEVPAPEPLPPVRSAPAAETPPTEDSPTSEQPPSVGTGTGPATADPTRSELQPRTGLSVWVVQVGAFSSRENAERLVQQLRAAGLDTLDPDQVELRGRQLYRVQVGPEIERARAEALLPKVKEVSGLDGKVLAYP